jgi:hypothetical protein
MGSLQEEIPAERFSMGVQERYSYDSSVVR